METQTVELAAQLRELRVGAGNPSFRTMAGRSGQISHTTLYEAVSGTRFPSWETTREFVRVCGGDEEQWRARWEAARAPAPPPAPVPPRRRLRGWIWGGALAALGAVTLAVTTAGSPPPPPVAAVPASGPVVDGDASRFLADVTIPDGTEVHVNAHFTKVWSVENAGTVAWHNRYLQQQHPAGEASACVAPDRVPIGDTNPGERAMITVPVVAGPTAGTCWVNWKIVDERGRPFFPANRPIYFFVTVVG